MLSWVLGNLRQLHLFVGSVYDYGALCGVRNFSKMLVKNGCLHVADLKKNELDGSEVLGDTSKDIKSVVRLFISSFWARFGRADVRACAEARRAEV